MINVYKNTWTINIVFKVWRQRIDSVTEKKHLQSEKLLTNFYFLSLFAQDKEHGTPLHAAAYLGDANTMELLIASGRKSTILLRIYE